jgi:hypothetical protein
VLDFPETSSGQVFEVGKRAHFTINPSSYINMQRGGRDFSGEARFNAIKRFLNEKLEQIERENKFKDFY